MAAARAAGCLGEASVPLGIIGVVFAGMLAVLLLGPGTFVLGLLAFPVGLVSLLLLVSPSGPSHPLLLTESAVHRLAGWSRVGAATVDVLFYGLLLIAIDLLLTELGVALSPEAGRDSEVAPGVWLFTQLTLSSAMNARGWSPGKRVLRLRVIRGDGEPPGIARGVARALVAWVSLITVAGYGWAMWDRGRQTWHDKAAGTYMVHAHPLARESILARCPTCGTSVSAADSFCRGCGVAFRWTDERATTD